MSEMDYPWRWDARTRPACTRERVVGPGDLSDSRGEVNHPAHEVGCRRKACREGCATLPARSARARLSSAKGAHTRDRSSSSGSAVSGLAKQVERYSVVIAIGGVFVRVNTV